jgi:hypothetical protein
MVSTALEVWAWIVVESRRAITLEKSARLMKFYLEHNAPPSKKLHFALCMRFAGWERSQKSDSLNRAKHPNREALRLY